MLAAASAVVAGSETVAVASRTGIGRAGNSIGLAKSGESTQKAFGPATLPAGRAFDFIVRGGNPAQALVGRATLGAAISVNRHCCITTSKIKIV
jgi:hypothetical protein